MIVCLGELIVDLIAQETECPLWQVVHFEKHFGGSPANVAVGVHHHGVPVALWTRVGDDSFGRFLIEELRRFGISCENVSIDDRYPTRLAFAGYLQGRERTFEIHNRKSADQYLRREHLQAPDLEGCLIFHFGGAALLGEVSFETTHTLLRLARKHHCLISFDPNIPLRQIKTAHQIISRFFELLPFVDILKTDRASWSILGQGEEPDAAMKRGDYRLMILTEGAEGSHLLTARHPVRSYAHPALIVDTTGAGDAYMARILTRITGRIRDSMFEELSADELKDWADDASAWAARIITFRGAITAYHNPPAPTTSE